uniref:Uncharacterized protein n=1 Tax=Corethron hystrix TaxID=216773 RepID=A0A7S1B727_9STRA
MSNNIEECAQYKISTKNEGGARQYRSLICGLAPLQSSVVGRPSPPSLPSKEDDDYVVPPDPHALSLHLTRLLNDPSPLLPYPLPDGSICSDNNRDTLSVPCAPTHASLLAHAELDLFCGPSNGAISHRPLHPHVSYFAALYCVRRSDWDASFHRACDLRWFRFEDGWEDDDGSFPSLWEEAAAKVLMAAVEGRACSIRERIRNMLVRCIVAGVATLTVAWTGGWCLGAACAGWAEAVLCTAGVQVVRVLAAFVFFFEIWDDNIHYGYGQECRQKLAETSMAPSDITERFWLRRCTLSTGAMTFKSPYLARITLTLVSIQQWIQATERVGQDGTFLQRSVYFLYSILLLLWNLSIGSIQLICVRASYCFEGIFERILSLLTKEFPYDDDTDEDFIKSKEHLVKKLGTTLGLRSHGDVVVIWRRRSKRLHDEAVYYAQEVLMARSPLAEECANAATPSNRESHHHTIMTSLQRRHHHHRHASSFSHKMYHGLSSSSRRRWHHQESHQYYRRRNSFRVRSNITEEMAAEEHHGCGIEVRIETPECHTSHCRQTPGLHQSGDVGSGNMPCPIYHRHGTGSRFEWHRSPGTTHMLTHQEGDISLADSTCGTPLALPASDFVAGTMQRTICEEDCHPDGNGTEVRSFRNVDNMGPTSLSLSSSTEKENVGGWNVLIGRAQKKKCHHASPTSTRFSVGRFSYFGKGHAPTNMTTAPSPPPLPLSPTSAPSPSFSPISNGGHRNRQARHLLSFSSSLANGAMRSWRTTRPPPVTIPPVPPYHDPWRDEGVSALDPSIPDVAHVTPPPHPRDASFPDVPSLPWWDDKRRDPVAPIPVPETYIPEHRRHHTIHGKHLASRSYSSSSAVEDQYFLGQEEEFQGLHSGRSPILRPSSLCSSSRKRQLHVDEHYEEDSDSFSDSCYEGGSVCTDMSFDTNSEVGTVITLGTDVTAGGGLGRSPGGRGMGGERLDARQWVDVGVRLGVRLLNNDAVQRVIAPKINATTAAKPVMEGEGGQRLLDPGDGIILSASSLLNESQGGLKDSTALLKDAGGSAPQRIEERGAAMQLLNRIKKASAVDLPSATTGGLGEIPTKNETFRIGEEGKDETLEYEISDKKLLSSSSTTDEVIISTGEHMITSTHVVPKHSIWTTASCLLPMVTATHGHDQEQPQGPTAKQHVYHNKKDQLNRNKQVPYRSPSNRRSRTAYVQYHGNSAKRRSVCIDAPPPSPSSEPIFCHVNTSTSSSPDYWPNSNSFGESDLGLTTTTTSTNISMNTNTPRRKWHSNTELQYHLGSSLAPPQPEPEPIKTTNTTTADTTFNMRKILESAAVHADFFEGRAVCGKIDPWESVTAAYIVPPTSQPLHPESSCPHHRRSSLVSTEDCESGNGLLRQNSAVGSCIEVTLERQMPRRNKYQHAPLARGCKVVVPLFPQAWNLPGCFEPKPRRKGETRLVPHQMATVVSSRRIYVPPTSRDRNVSSQIPQTETNTLELVLHLDRCFLRNGQFAVLHHRIPDTSPLPRHSAYPIGSPVITSFGLAILVGWRVEDDVHVVRNLWGRGRRDSAAAYLHRKSLRGRAEASVGFEVDTDIGRGVVLGYVGSGGKDWRGGKYVVSLHRVAGSRCGSERSLRDTNVPNNSRGRSMGTANAHFTNGRDIVMLDGRKIRGCKSAVFVPVLEQIREAARYQIQYDAYEAALIDTERRARGASYLQLRMLGNGGGLLLETKSDESDADSSNLFVKKRSSRGLTLSDLEVFLSSLLRAINESPSLGEDFNAFMSSFIEVVERIGTTAIDMTRHKGKERERREKEKCNSNDGYDATARSGERVQWIMPPDEESIVKSQAIETDATVCTAGGPDSTRNNSANFPDFSVIDDLLGFLTNKDKGAEETSATTTRTHKTSLSSSFSSTAPLSSDQLDDQNDPTVKREKRAFIILSVLLRAVAIAKVNVRDRADIKIALSGVRETLLLIRTIIQVRTQNISQHTRTLRRQTRKKLEQFIGPIQRRLGHFGKKLLTRIEREGEKNRIKHSRFLELLIRDGRLIRAVDNERWEKCLSLVERAIVKAQIVDAKTLAQYKQSVMLLYHTLAPTSGGQASAKRNTEKLARLAKVLKVLLSPKRTLLKFVQKKEVLDALERIMVRVFSDDAEASMMLNIYAFNFHNFRELILLRNQDIAGEQSIFCGVFSY